MLSNADCCRNIKRKETNKRPFYLRTRREYFQYYSKGYKFSYRDLKLSSEEMEQS